MLPPPKWVCKWRRKVQAGTRLDRRQLFWWGQIFLAPFILIMWWHNCGILIYNSDMSISDRIKWSQDMSCTSCLACRYAHIHILICNFSNQKQLPSSHIKLSLHINLWSLHINYSVHMSHANHTSVIWTWCNKILDAPIYWSKARIMA